MSAYDTLEANYYEWVKNPEPSLPAMDPQVILDANTEGGAWLYNYEAEETEWVKYHGEPIDVVE